MNVRNITFTLAAALSMAACTPKSDMDRYIDDLMSRMTLEQKIGQLNLHSAHLRDGRDPWTRDRFPGSACTFHVLGYGTH